MNGPAPTSALPRHPRPGWLVPTLQRLRWPLAIAAVLAWLSYWPPTSTAALTGGLAAATLGHRLLAPAAVRARRRATLRARTCMAVVIGILFAAASPALADDSTPPWGVPSATDYCKFAPVAESPGQGITGFLDPQQGLPMDGTAYGSYGYAGLFWFAYDPGCVTSAASLLGQTVAGSAGQGVLTAVSDPSGASGQTSVGNMLLKAAKLESAWVTGMRARALDRDYFAGLDAIVATGVHAIRDLLITPWIGLPLVLLGLILLNLARKGHAAETAHRVGIAAAGLLIMAFLGQYPLAAADAADGAVVNLQQGFDRGFFALLPDDITPIIWSCNYDMAQFAKPPTFDSHGSQLVAGTACLQAYRPSLDPSVKWATDAAGVVHNYAPDYFDRWYFPEVMVNSTIVPYWEQGLLGTTDRTGPNADLARQFQTGQAVNTFTAAQNAYDTKALQDFSPPAGTVWCTYSENRKVCGRSDQAGVPGPIMSEVEGNYRAAIQAAGDARYPYIQGRAGNRIAAGTSALAAVTAAAPLQGAAYTAVWAARLLLRIFIFAGLFAGLALILVPNLLRRIVKTIGTVLITILFFSAVGSLMTFLTLQMLANPAVQNHVGPTGGLMILAGISLIAWFLIHPMRRIGRMVSAAAVGDPAALSTARRTATGLPRRAWGSARRLRDVGRQRALRRAVRDLDRPETGDAPDDQLPTTPSDYTDQPRPETTTRPAPARPAETSRPVPIPDTGPQWHDLVRPLPVTPAETPTAVIRPADPPTVALGGADPVTRAMPTAGVYRPGSSVGQNSRGPADVPTTALYRPALADPVTRELVAAR